MRTVTVTCGTEGCGNAGHAITLEVPDDLDTFLCGVCGTNLTPEVSPS